MSRGSGYVGTLPGVTSAADLSGYTGRFAKMATATTVTYAAAATDAIVGIIADGGIDSGDPVSIDTRVGVIVELEVDGAAGEISVGSMLTSDSAGRGIATTADGNIIGAMALEASTTQGDVIRVRTMADHLYIA
jgi:hypothetical protein